MIRKSAMSVTGYAIVLVIMLGIVMIISAPMMMDKYKKDKNSPNKNYSQEEYDSKSDRDNRENIDDKNDYNSQDDVSRRLRIMEDTLNARLDSIESRQAQRSTTTQSISDKYVCEIEGNVDADGNVTSIDNMSMDEVKRRKIVFVCEYRN